MKHGFTTKNGLFFLVLHAHLPYVRHPEHPRFMEEEWFFEAVAETYVPLLQEFRHLRARGVSFQVTLGVTPPLASMLADELLRSRLREYLGSRLDLAEAEVVRTRKEDPRFTAAATAYVELFGDALSLFDARRGDLLWYFQDLQDSGHLELITCGATHGYLPLLATDEGRRAQIRVATRSHEKHFGRRPRGIWLPECAYHRGLDSLLADEGLEFFFVDQHGIAAAEPPPPGIHGPVRTPAGPLAFGRDPEAGRQVWSATEGYPGDPAYREFYKDIGYEAPQEMIQDHLLPDGRRHGVGIKTHRITGNVPLSQKEPYDPSVARLRVEQHADHFVASRLAQLSSLLPESGGHPPCITAPYDAELFGHWWFEGPAFLGKVLERLANSPLQASTPATWKDSHLPSHPGLPAPSSWGGGGYYEVWLNEKTAFFWPPMHGAERRMVALARDFAPHHGKAQSPLLSRALRQAGRELLLAQASDWTFLISGGTAADYAERKIRLHLARFEELHRQIRSDTVNEDSLALVEGADNLFPELDYRSWLPA